jgi:predicted GNAT family N-acyltransferase
MKEHPEIITKKPCECSEKELEDFTDLVSQGGEVTLNGLNERIKKAEALIFLVQGGRLKGIAAVKNPVESYKKDVFNKAQTTAQYNNFLFELGWIFVTESSRGRGFSNKLVQAAIDAVGNQGIYATSRLDNEPMHKALEKYGFVRDGEAYPSNDKNNKIVLFVNT